jgi:hypothetical protein
VSLELPRSAHLAWWLTAWLRGHEVTDHALEAITRDEAHAVVGLPDGGGSLLDLLVHVRRSGADHAGLALPVEGDLLGLGGPRALNDPAVDAGEATVLPGLGLVPSVTGSGVTWSVTPADRRQLPDVGEADRALRAALVETANELAALDVARWRPDVADALMDLHHRPHVAAPAGTPPRCVELAARGLQAWAIVDLALEDDGGALSAYEIERRRGALRPLERSARRALVAACSPEVWPQP